MTTPGGKERINENAFGTPENVAEYLDTITLTDFTAESIEEDSQSG